jgi:CDP-4-dehydro-6-deoxyglucose reductase
MIERENGEKSAFSMASSPHRGRDLELHVLAREASALSLVDQLQRNSMVNVELPYGESHLADLPNGPLVLIAAGTGMGQMQSLIEHCRAEGFQHPVHLYWGVRRPEEFYEMPHWDEWKQLPNLFLHKVVSDLCGWEGRCGMLHEAVCEDISDLSSVIVYASGSPNMVYATLDALVSAGMDAHQMHADVFAYAPRG